MISLVVFLFISLKLCNSDISDEQSCSAGRRRRLLLLVVDAAAVLSIEEDIMKKIK